MEQEIHSYLLGVIGAKFVENVEDSIYKLSTKKAPKHFVLIFRKFIVTDFSHKKNNLEHLGHNVKKQCFLKLFLGSQIWTFLKMSIFHFPFYFWEKFNTFQNTEKTIKNMLTRLFLEFQ